MSDKPFYVGTECRFAVYVNPKFDNNDYHMVKETIHYSDGTTKPSIKIIENYKRSFYVTKPGQRNHKDKKEWEYIDKLTEFRTTQSQLVRNAARALGEEYKAQLGLREVSNSPYLYGSDILSTSLIKNEYAVKHPDLNTPFTVCALDVETDVVHGTNQIILTTIVFKDKIVCVATKDFVLDDKRFVETIHKKVDQYIKEYMVKRDYKLEVLVERNEMEMLFKIFSYLHEWKPDLLSIWNINYDIKKIIEACERYGVDPKDLFSDPEVPDHIKYFRYREGPNQKKKADGTVLPISASDQWHTVFSTSSFYVIDAMCVYRVVRLAKPAEQSYALDNILDIELGIRKLKFKEADAYSGLKWHEVMQTNFKHEYTVYNIFDVLSMMELEYKTTDLSVALPIFADKTDFSKFNSQPRKIVNELHFKCLEHGRVIGTTGSEMITDLDLKTLPLTGWIVTLPSTHMSNNGIKCIEEDPTLVTSIHPLSADIDVGSAYPTNQCVFNVSKETTKREVISVKGMHFDTFSLLNINALSGAVNAVDYCTQMFKFPPLKELEEHF